ncbi:hypothetical protein JYU34_000682 [Plutella xylostella]|uniref:Uncharacterized protein n=1 Tax=Plutella xylostella TaxID=51655 RepID=A0ABQ7R8A4_PLUXY|nr:hypothetical protein JYU34_000682 [Plutella xylostella]
MKKETEISSSSLKPFGVVLVLVKVNLEGTEHSGVWGALQQLALMFFNTNFGINFILYCMSGQNFRRALRQMLPRWWRREPAAVVRVDTSVPVRASSLSSKFLS